MSTWSRFQVSLAAWSVLTAAVWTLFVPAPVSVGGGAWLNAGTLALGLGLTVIVLVGHLQPARTLSPVPHKETGRTGPRWS